MHYLPVLFPRQISCYLTCLLPPTTSSYLCSGNLTCLLSLNFASASSLSACCLPGLPLQRPRPHSEARLCSPTRLPDCCPFGLVNIVNKVLNCATLHLYFSWFHSHMLHLVCFKGKLLSWSKLASVCTDCLPKHGRQREGSNWPYEQEMIYPISSVLTTSSIRSHLHQSSETTNIKM